MLATLSTLDIIIINVAVFIIVVIGTPEVPTKAKKVLLSCSGGIILGVMDAVHYTHNFSEGIVEVVIATIMFSAVSLTVSAMLSRT